MCGADPRRPHVRRIDPGSSPRVRSRRPREIHAHQPLGIISACAEQTSSSPSSSSSSQDHLRVCGADTVENVLNSIKDGSSPRVRSRLVASTRLPLRRGIISACAEQTYPSFLRQWAITDHLRVCGADSGIGGMRSLMAGSSPRVRSRHLRAERVLP